MKLPLNLELDTFGFNDPKRRVAKPKCFLVLGLVLALVLVLALLLAVIRF